MKLVCELDIELLGARLDGNRFRRRLHHRRGGRAARHVTALLADGHHRPNRVHEIVGFLSTVGETSYLDLVRPTAAE